MELLPLLVALLVCSILINAYLYLKLHKFEIFHENHIERTQAEIRGYRTKISELEKAPPAKLTIEAQQILHDMTAHGQTIVRITPISPTDIFWRSPK